MWSALLITSLLAGSGASTPARSIPLEEVWAWRMPRTQDVSRLESPLLGARTNYSEEITRSLTTRLPNQKSAGKALVVKGEGPAALKNARDALLNNKKKKTNLSQGQKFYPGEKITLVFFSRQLARYVHLDSIIHKGSTIRVRYRVVPHKEAVFSSHFALIPLGEMKVGKYSVVMEQSKATGSELKNDAELFSEEDKSRIVCGPTSFTVSSIDEDDP